MIKVNLLATAPGKAAPREWIPQEQRSAVIGLACLLVTGLAIGGWWYYVHNTKTKIDARITAAEAQLVKLKEAAALVEKTTAKKNELAERLNVIERLRESKRGPVNLLETLSQSLPDGLWLLEVKQSGRSVQVDGRAMSISAVTDFTERLQNSGVFDRPVEILTTSTEAVEETPVVRFSVKADVVAPQAPLSAQAPAAAGVKVAGSVPARAGA
jgi:type IV pilus assembly protein PilN